MNTEGKKKIKAKQNRFANLFKPSPPPPAPKRSGGYRAFRNADEEANAANALTQLFRGQKQMKMKCSERGMARVHKLWEARTDQAPKEPAEGNVVDVILITEGLGNRRNMNYYGPEAIASGPAVFEGKPCFLDHPSESEERDIPERRVRQKCGYFKNCRVETLSNATACIGELHFDLSEDGDQAYRKACTALHYKDEFPGSESEYVGLSINADGDVEDRTVEWQGETLQVNYVTRFRDAMSCDIVTSPARGGRFLALVESAAGAIRHEGAKPTNKEVGPMKKGLKKALEAAQTALEKATKENDFEAMKKSTAEADKLFKAFIKEATKAAYQDESEDGESEDMNGESEDETEDEGEGEGDSHTTVTHKVVKKTGKAAVPESSEDEDDSDDGDDTDDDEKTESNRIAVSAMVKEAGIELPKSTIDRLVAGSLKKAKTEIAELKWMRESIVKQVIKSIKVPVATLAKVTESDRDVDGSGDLLTSCIH